MRKFYLLFIIVILLLGLNGHAQNGNPINKNIYGLNVWFYDYSDPNDPSNSLNDIINDIISSGITIARIGGIDANFRPLYSWNQNTFAITLANVWS